MGRFSRLRAWSESVVARCSWLHRNPVFHFGVVAFALEAIVVQFYVSDPGMFIAGLRQPDAINLVGSFPHLIDGTTIRKDREGAGGQRVEKSGNVTWGSVRSAASSCRYYPAAARPVWLDAIVPTLPFGRIGPGGNQFERTAATVGQLRPLGPVLVAQFDDEPGIGVLYANRLAAGDARSGRTAYR